MANITKRGDTYRIKVSCGYDASGKQIIKSKTFKPASGMTEKQIQKAVNREAALFEERCRTGQVLDGNIRFSEFVDIWRERYAKTQLKPKTIARYEGLLTRIIPAIGHIRLDRLQPQHLLEFYENLAEEGIRQSVKYRAKIDFKAFLSEHGITKAALAKNAAVNVKTIDTAVLGQNISRKSADKISKALNMSMESLFEEGDQERALSEKTILHHHRLISAILQTAVQWQVILSNPCARVKPPKVPKAEVKYFDDVEAVQLLEALENEDAAHKAMIYLLIYTGMRRGELCGLEWSDIDFEHDVIQIKRNSVYVPGKGIITTTPKTESSVRVDKVPHVVMEVLKEHKHQQNIQRISVGADWKNSDRLFTQWNGKPIFPDSVSAWFMNFTKAIGLEGRSLKSLRHTNASLMIASGVDVRTVAARLGHAQTSTTTNIYAHLIRSADERAAEALEDLLSGKKA